MTPWTRRLIGPGPTRDAGPTQPLDDTPAAAHGCWIPQDELARHVTLQSKPIPQNWLDTIIDVIDSHERASRWLARCVIAAVAAFVLFVAWGGGGS